MNIEWNWRTIIILSIVAVLLVGTNVGQYFWIWKPKLNELTESYESEIAHLEEWIRQIGPMVTIWTVNEESDDIYPGKVIEESDLTTMQLPESLIQPSFILDPTSIIGRYYRIGLSSGTPLSWDNIMSDPLDDTTREYDIVANTLPIGLKAGDYVDYRIVYPRGEDYIVIPHKRVEQINGQTVKVRLNEMEIHHYQASLIDYFLQSRDGAMLYMTKYIEPGVQKPAEEYYAVPDHILNIMTIDPNIVDGINRQVNDSLRTTIETNIMDAYQFDTQRISSGRNEVSGKIGQGANEYNNRLRELQEAEERARRNESLPPPSSTAPSEELDETAPDHVYETPGYNNSVTSDEVITFPDSPSYDQDYTIPTDSEGTNQDYSIPAESPAFNIEEGVVE